MKIVDDKAYIPYYAHCERMLCAEKRENRVKALLSISVLINIILASVIVFTR